MIPERGRKPFQQIFLSQNSDPINTVYHRNQLVPKVTLWTKYDQLVLRKITEIVAIRCHILRLKCTKFDFHWGSAPDPSLQRSLYRTSMARGFNNNNNNTLIYIAPACRMTSEALSKPNLTQRLRFVHRCCGPDCSNDRRQTSSSFPVAFPPTLPPQHLSLIHI